MLCFGLLCCVKLWYRMACNAVLCYALRCIALHCIALRTIHACMYACMYLMYLRCMSVCLSVCLTVCPSVCMHVCMCTCEYTYTCVYIYVERVCMHIFAARSRAPHAAGCWMPRNAFALPGSPQRSLESSGLNSRQLHYLEGQGSQEVENQGPLVS